MVPESECVSLGCFAFEVDDASMAGCLLALGDADLGLIAA